MIINKYLTLIMLLLCYVADTNCQIKQLPTFSEFEVDTLMHKYLIATERSCWKISKADSGKARQLFNKEVNNLNKIAGIYEKIDKEKVNYSTAIPSLLKLLTSAKNNLESALKLNPFDLYIKDVIEVVYLQLDEVYMIMENKKERVKLLNKLLLIVKDKSLCVNLLNHLGKIYREYQLWEQSKMKFHQAVCTIFEGEEADIDSTLLFDSIYYRGEAYLKLYQNEEALESFERAQMIALNQSYFNQLTNLIKYINWDDGNIQASEQFEAANKLAAQKKYIEAELAYLNLKKNVKTKYALQQTQLSLSLLQFDYLDKKEVAIESLWTVILKNLTLNSANNTDNKNYWDNYGYMCIELANKFSGIDRKVSFCYLLKLSWINCPYQASAYLGLAGLSLNNPGICLKYCNRALEIEHLLTPDEKKELYHLFYLTHRTKGEFGPSTIWYRKYYEIKSNDLDIVG